jgi:hypothetical protein
MDDEGGREDDENRSTTARSRDARSRVRLSRRSAIRAWLVGLVGGALGASGSAAADFAGGDGSESDPYLIDTWEGLYEVRFGMDDHYVLIDDLGPDTAGYGEHASEDANDGEGWDPIGTAGGGFSGTFDGRGHTISGLYVDRTGTGDDLIGLFGSVGPGGVIKNVGLKDNDVAGRNSVGALVGDSTGDITRCFATGPVAGEDQYQAVNVGGLVGNNSGVITECYAAGAATGDFSFGGLVGLNDGDVVETYYNSSANVSGIGDPDGDTNDATGLSQSEITGDDAATNMTAFDFETVWRTVADDYPELRTDDVDGGTATGTDGGTSDGTDGGATDGTGGDTTDGADDGTTAGTGDGDGDDPCFIATAAYGTPTAAEIDVLREFRDDVLHRNALGRAIVRTYYWGSPPIANWIRRSPRRRRLVRSCLVDPLVAMVRRIRPDQH